MKPSYPIVDEFRPYWQLSAREYSESPFPELTPLPSATTDDEDFLKPLRHRSGYR